MGRVSKKPKIVDLFSGCGGFGLGAELGGFEAVVAVDLDPNLQSAYGLNFPTTKVVNGDVSKLDRSSWKNFLDKNIIDGVIGGPPCQGFSRIGKKAPNDPRNSLIGHFYRHVKLLKPKFFVMENVVGILDEASRSHLDAALDEVPGRYNVLPPIIVNAVDHGAPTNRRRVVVVGYDPADFCRVSALEIARASVSNRVTVRDAIADLPGPVTDAKNPRDFGWSEYPRNGQQTGSYVTRMRAMPTHLGWAEAICKLMHGKVSGLLETKHNASVIKRFEETPPGSTEPISRYPKLKWSGYCPTLRAGTGSERGSYQAMRPIHPSEPRVITVREAARLQGFPDWFVFHPSKWHSFRMIGNSVSPPLSRHILSTLLKKMANSRA